LELLLQALVRLPLVRPTIVGCGPEGKRLQSLSEDLHIESRVFFVVPTHGQEKTQLFASHDLLILPSLTEISPHTALEARAAGLPVLLTQETGLSAALRSGMVCADLSGVEQIVAAVANVRSNYQAVAQQCSASLEERPWSCVVREHIELFSPSL
jgi:glycosyltransferase involved in cell wall biosynthesis